MLCKILVDYSPAEGWKVGDIVNITNADKLIQEGKVEEVVGSATKRVEILKKEEVVAEVKEKKEYICTICGFVANTGAGLKSHMRKHNA